VCDEVLLDAAGLAEDLRQAEEEVVIGDLRERAALLGDRRGLSSAMDGRLSSSMEEE